MNLRSLLLLSVLGGGAACTYLGCGGATDGATTDPLADAGGDAAADAAGHDSGGGATPESTGCRSDADCSATVSDGFSTYCTRPLIQGSVFCEDAGTVACTADTECKTGQLCRDGYEGPGRPICAPACTSDDECDLTETCSSDGHCLARTCDQCPPSFSCATGTCTVPDCSQDSDCAGGYCVDNMCSPMLGMCFEPCA